MSILNDVFKRAKADVAAAAKSRIKSASGVLRGEIPIPSGPNLPPEEIVITPEPWFLTWKLPAGILGGFLLVRTMKVARSRARRRR